MGKKNAFVTTIGFNKNDPAHVQVAEFLNGMERGKAQYIVKAVMVYQNMQQSGEGVPATESSFDYDRVRNIVYQVLEERERQGNSQVPKHTMAKQEKSKPEEEDNPLSKLDENALNGILASIAAFQKK
jgi:hypothetical protein